MSAGKQQMRAAVLEEARPAEQSPLVLREVDRPRPADGEVVLRVRACGVCRTDLHIVEDVNAALAELKNDTIRGAAVVLG